MTAAPPTQRITRIARASSRIGVALFLVIQSAALAEGITVQDTIEYRQLLIPFRETAVDGAISYSPDHSRYLAIFSRGDLRRGGTSIEFFTGLTVSLKAAAKGRFAATLFTRSRRLNWLRYNPPIWLSDQKSILFLWKQDNLPQQVVELDLQTGRLTRLTKSVSDVTSFGTDGRGSVTVYASEQTAPAPSSQAAFDQGFAITNQQFQQLQRGWLDGRGPRSSPSFYFSNSTTSGRPFPMHVLETERFPEISVSPNGNYAIVTAPPSAAESAWTRYLARSNVYLLGLDRLLAGDPGPTAIAEYWLMDLRKENARPLINAPLRFGGRPMWSPDSQSLAIGPTFLPTNSRAAIDGEAFAIVDAHSGAIQELDLPRASRQRLPTSGSAWSISWSGNQTVQLANDSAIFTFVHENSRWRFAAQGLKRGQECPRLVGCTVLIESKQNLNTPPLLIAREQGSGSEEKILDPNPEMKMNDRALVRPLHWHDSKSRNWSGTLYLPRQSLPESKLMPLVVQLDGVTPSPDEFSLLGIPVLTAAASQPLASRGIAVLNMKYPDEGIGIAASTPEEPKVIQDGVESAIESLSRQRLVDASKVGLLGFSHTGWWVEYILTHSSFAYSAANIADNIDGSYGQWIMMDTQIRGWADSIIGAPPIGHGLARWLVEAPGFNTQAVQAAVRLEADQGTEGVSGPIEVGVAAVGPWEIFSQLREAGKPVELYFVPHLDEAEHQLEGPDQQFASRSGTVDWFDFWLNGHEDPDASKQQQYVRWEKLCGLHIKQVSKAKTSCVSSHAH